MDEAAPSVSQSHPCRKGNDAAWMGTRFPCQFCITRHPVLCQPLKAESIIEGREAHSGT